MIMDKRKKLSDFRLSVSDTAPRDTWQYAFDVLQREDTKPINHKLLLRKGHEADLRKLMLVSCYHHDARFEPTATLILLSDLHGLLRIKGEYKLWEQSRLDVEFKVITSNFLDVVKI